MHRFFVDPQDIINQQVHFSQAESRHIERVLRLRPGDTVVVFDGSGWEYQVELLEKASSALVGQIISREYQDRESPFKLALVQGIAKGEKMDTIIQKAVEAGIDSIYPLLTERTVVQLAGQKSQQKQERWQTISRQACKQCRRNRVPFVSPPLEFASFLEQHQGQPILMLYESEQECTLRQVLKRSPCPTDTALVPHGRAGRWFSEAEAAMARQKGAILVSLGPRILRTETAGLLAAGIILYEFGNLG